MTKQQIQHKLKDHTLDRYERERLLQLLHYYTVEHIDPAVTQKPQSGRSQKARSVKRKKRTRP